MIKKVKKIILGLLIFIILPMLGMYVADEISKIVTMEMIMKIVYIGIVILGIYFIKEGVE